MTRRSTLRAFSLLLLPVLLGLGAGCTTRRDPVFRAPHEALDKRMFEGEFFYKMTVVDLPYSVDYSFVGQNSDTKIIRWEITRDWLIAYDVYDKVNARDAQGNRTNNRTPLLAFPIQMHFDLRYQENPITGEDLPIVSPNQDMDWYEAPYFMVNPSISGITTFPDEYMNLIFQLDQPFRIEPLAGFERLEFYDKGHNFLHPRDYRTARRKDASLSVDEIVLDTTSVYTPNVNFNGWWNWTREEFFFRLNYEPARVSYRHHFRRMRRDELANNGFVRVDYQEPVFRKFGYFRSDFVVYDQIEGLVTDQTWYKWANYFNIAPKPGTTAPQKIVYHVNTPEHPKRLISTSCAIGVEFNQAFREAFALRSAAGDAVKQDELPAMPSDELWIKQNWNTNDLSVQAKIAEMCLGSRDAAGVPGVSGAGSVFDDANDVFQLKPNYFEPYEPKRDGVDLDGKANAVEIDEATYRRDYYPYVQTPASHDWSKKKTFMAACELSLERKCQVDDDRRPVLRFRHRLGTIGESFIYYVAKPTEYGILGVAQWAANPETGQILSAVGHTAGGPLNSAVTRAMDQFDYLAGFASIDDLIASPTRSFKTNYDVVTANAKFAAPDGGTSPVAPDAMSYLPAPRSQNDLGRLLEREAKRLPPLSGRLPLSAVRGTKWEALMTDPSLADWLYPGLSRDDKNVRDMFGPESMFGLDGLRDKLRKLDGMIENCYMQGDWLDGALIELAERKIAERNALAADLRAQGKNEAAALQEATATIRAAVWYEFERTLWKGVTQHEIGHSIGLRHNFGASTDELNFVGVPPQEDPQGVGEGYWPEQKAWQEAYRQIRRDNPNATGMQLHELGAGIPSKRHRFRYASVMDYQNEVYIHSQGLGNYDKAAIRFVYGQRLAKYVPNTNFSGSPEGGAALQVEYRRWFRVEDQPGGRYNLYLKEEPDKVTLRREANGSYTRSFEPDRPTSILENGDTKPYVFCTDHQRNEDAFCNVWDAGTTGREIARNFIREYNRNYYRRFFRRGNPRMTELGWTALLWGVHFPIAHFALDFNFNFTRVNSWWEAMLVDRNNTSNVERNSYLAALGGVKPSDDQFDTLVPARTMGDYLTAAMEGFNFFVYDIIYRPDTGAYIQTERDDVPFFEKATAGKFWRKNQFIVPDDRLGDFGGQFQNINIDIDVGRFHRNRFDIQDNPAISEERLLRRGFSTEKTAAIFVLSNTGWPVEKYGRENMANGFHYASDGFQNAIFQILSDANSEDAMLSFSPYCVQANATGAKTPFTMVKVNPPIQAGWLWNTYDRFDFDKRYSRPYQPSKSMCAAIDSKLEPVHAGWIYFDKLWPTLWSTYGLSNISADMTVFQYFTAERIPVSDYARRSPVDPAKQAEFLNTAGNFWFRATVAPDGRPTPGYEVVKKAARLRKICEDREWDSNISPGTPIGDCPGWRTLEVIEATLTNNADFARFWGSITSLIFGR